MTPDEHRLTAMDSVRLQTTFSFKIVPHSSTLLYAASFRDWHQNNLSSLTTTLMVLSYTVCSVWKQRQLSQMLQ